LDAILNWGITVVLWFQQFSPTLDLPFTFFSFLGKEDFFILFLPLVFWCIDRRNGLRLAFIFLISSYLGGVAKEFFHQPRPYQYDSRVRMIIYEASYYGLPSLHTQNTVVVWGFLVSAFKRKWIRILAIILAIFIPLSRIYLGLHFPTDLLGGYLLGAIILALGLWLIPVLEPWLVKKGLLWQVGILLAVTVVMAVFMPTGDETGISTTATLFGAGLGLAFERRWVRFETDKLSWKLLLRLLLGLAIIMGLRYGLKALFGDLQPVMLLRFIRYTIMGIFLTLGAPWLFVKLKI
jgi:membrane-associated phospholipid phosphatase